MERIGLGVVAPSPAPRASWIARMFPVGRKPAGQLAPSQKPQLGRTRRMLAVAAVAVAVVAGGLAGWGLGNGTSSPAQTPLNSAALLSASHQTVGKIFLYQGSPRWLYMSVDMPSGNGTVLCQVQSQDGQITTLGSFRLTDGHGYWGSPTTGTHGTVTGARLVTTNGTVLATASFHSA